MIQEIVKNLEQYISNGLIEAQILTQIISLVGSIFVILTYIIFKSLRTFAFKLVCFLSFSDFLICISFLSGMLLYSDNFQQPDKQQQNQIYQYDQEQNSVLCKATGFLLNFGYLSSFLWTSVIAYSMHNSLKYNFDNNEKQLTRKFLCFVYGLAIIWNLCIMMTMDFMIVTVGLNRAKKIKISYTGSFIQS
ncbi:hypothetical protein PPERSA_04408 [Pseudocohnilembus persalinus]|uniref:G-protein coupled receptors family 2 profile 2 domain-containing protein n=1 Tax=Pseudocohnilembus persalinus TaxID=266149 RepID=A0A0V0QQW9_PSEPJ|nr:hypothetical protein PPERSA_04408 [Pseudocohnilembus persalinus]|eukprot:KRX04593.1 hypothetical protein PPERSA_04408 [Pseudocohnilembus persalinus]